MTDLKTPGTARTRLAVAGARAATDSVFGRRPVGERIGSKVFLALLLLGLSVAVAGLAGMLIWMIQEGAPRFDLGLFTDNPSVVNPEEAGYRPAIIGSVLVIVGVIVLIVPLGVGAAVYLEEFADKEKWYNRFVELNIQNLAGVPSIVFGILGLAFIVRAPLNFGFTVAAGSLTIAMLVLPTVILAAREAIRAVPPSIREGSLALGATPWQTVWRQVLPASTSGILTGVILAVARAIGEAAPLLMIGTVTFVTFDPSFFEGRFTTLPVQIFAWSAQPQEEFHQLAAAGVLVMLALVLAMNSFAIWLRNRYEQQW